MCPRLTAADSEPQQHVWFSSLPFQQFQALLTLFPKSFSSFPHGTCSLSVSSLYLALDEIYHLIYAPIPRSVTLRTSAVDGGHQAKHRILTQAHALFQEAYARTADRYAAGYIPKPKPIARLPHIPCRPCKALGTSQTNLLCSREPAT